MAQADLKAHSIGWIGLGRMGFPMARRLLKAGCDVAAWNRTRSKAEPLAAEGARIVDSPADLAGCDIVFTMVAGPDDLRQVVAGPNGVLSAARVATKYFVDCSSVSAEASQDVRAAVAGHGADLVAAPVSGNGKVVKAGRLTIVASGSQPAFQAVAPYLEAMSAGVTYVGEGERARIVKICHNVLLGVVTQCLSEITVLAEKSGVPRHAFLEFINQSVMGSTFSRYKTPAFVNLDYSVTFTPPLLRKDLDLGLALARDLDVPMPIAAATREIVQSVIGHGHTDTDFSILLQHEAEAANLKLEPENIEIGDGLSQPPASPPLPKAV
jgi:3-hydroxyisobutyrate dehydrogenase